LIVPNTDQNNLVGELPDELSALATLQILDFDDNGSLFGDIPATLGDLNRLEELIIASNTFSGVIPVQLFSATNLMRLDFEDNAITGTIPSAIGNLQDLDTLQLDSNMLTGVLEPRIGELGLLSKCREGRLVLPVPYRKSCSNNTLTRCNRLQIS
jgi:Leucine-rich repeat (LRR) protein